MENSQSKMIHTMFDVLLFIPLLGFALLMFQKSEDVQNLNVRMTEAKNTMNASQDTVDGTLYEDSEVDIYVGEVKGHNKVQTITGNGDVVTKASVYTDLLNMPSDITKIHINGTVYSNGPAGMEKIDGFTNIAYLISTGNESKLYSVVKNLPDTLIRTYRADKDGDIYEVTYTNRTI